MMTLQPFEEAIGAVCESDSPGSGRRERKQTNQFAGVVPPIAFFRTAIGPVDLVERNDIAHVRTPSGKRPRPGAPFRLIVGDGTVEVRDLGLGKTRRAIQRAEARAGVTTAVTGLDIER